MDRRQAVKTLSAMMGTSLLLPGALLASAENLMEAGALPKAKLFSRSQRKLVAAIAECIIPRTDTPGAKDAGVPQWIEVIVQDCSDLKDQAAFISGLTALDAAAVKQYAKPFVKLTYEEQIAFLTAQEKMALQEAKSGESKGPNFLLVFKDLTKFTYANSERGATEAFEYILVPGRWDGDMPLKVGQKVPGVSW